MPDPREIATELMQRFTYADDHRKQYDERAVQNYKLFTGYREPLPKSLKGRSNLHIPKCYELVDSLRARYLRALFSSSPLIDYIPDPLLYFQEGISPQEYLQMLTDAEDSAKYSTYLVDQQLRRAAVYKKFYDFVTSFLVFPAGILAVGWRYERKRIKQRGQVRDQELGVLISGVVEREVVAFDDNDLQYVDYYDFWADPRGTDLDNSRFAFHREYCTKAELEAKLVLLEQAGSGKVYIPDDWDALLAAGANREGGASERLGRIGMGTEANQGIWNDIKHGYQIELLHYWEDGRHAIVANGCEAVFDGGNPYWHGKKPFIAASFDARPGEFYGFSAVELIEHLQAELNTNRNQRIDNVSFVLNRMWKVRKDAGIDENDLISRPHGIVYVNSPEDVEALVMPDVTSSSYTEENISKQDMDNTLGAPAVVRGTEPDRKQTATEIITKGGAADLKFQVKVMLYEGPFERLALLLDMNNQQFIVNPRLFRIEDAWKVVTPDEWRGHHSYRPASANLDVTANREVRRQQLLELQKMLQENQYIDQYELLKLVLEAYGIRGTEKLLISKEQLAAAQQVPGGQPQQGAQGLQGLLSGLLPGPQAMLPGGAPPGQGQPAIAQQMLSNLAGQAMQGGGGGALP